MKKTLFFAAIAAAGLTACSNENDIVGGGTDVTPAEDGAVTFEAYSARATRAQAMTLDGLKDGVGFGVYAYDQNTQTYGNYSSSSSYPNFMYNQQVVACKGTTANHAIDAADHSTFTHWDYTPIKYYNNNYGARHSFYAYAPFNQEIEAAFELNKAPQIRYNAAQDIDLLWADPTMDIFKPGVTHKVQFNFKHALSKVNIYAAPFDDVVHGTTPGHTADGAIDGNTKVIVKNVIFVGNVASQGLLNLGDGSWTYEITGNHSCDLETPIDITHATTATPAGSPSSYANIVTNMTMIPSINGGKAKVRVIYDVITTDETHPENSTRRTCTNTSVDGIALEQGKNVNIYLDLGLTSVKVTADISDGWVDADNQFLDIPDNSYWHPYSYVKGTGDLVNMATFKAQSTAPTPSAADEYWYDTTHGVLKVSASDGGAGFEFNVVDASKSYNNDNTIYTVGATAGTVEAISTPMAYFNSTASTYKVWNSATSAWDNASMATNSVVYDLTPNSEGKIQTGADAAKPASWTAPDNGKFYTYTVNGKTYLLKWSTSEP